MVAKSFPTSKVKPDFLPVFCSLFPLPCRVVRTTLQRLRIIARMVNLDISVILQTFFHPQWPSPRDFAAVMDILRHRPCGRHKLLVEPPYASSMNSWSSSQISSQLVQYFRCRADVRGQNPNVDLAVRMTHNTHVRPLLLMVTKAAEYLLKPGHAFHYADSLREK